MEEINCLYDNRLYEYKRVLGRVKKKKIKALINSNKLEFLLIQETKMETTDDSLGEYLWGGASCDWVFRPSVGRSGGILCIWNKE